MTDSERIAELELSVRNLKTISTILCVAAVVALFGAWRSNEDVVNARQFIVRDSAGRARVYLGPLPDLGGQRPGNIGMAIFDTLGFERFGLGTRPSGSVGMGFDAPPGKGDPRNAERINIIADGEGGAQIRFLDRTTKVKGRILLLENNELAFDLLDWQDREIVTRRITAKGDTTIRSQR
jgi:hypothetical protein